MRAFTAIFSNLTAATGQWRDVCGTGAAAVPERQGAGLSQLSSSGIVAVCGIGVLCCAVGVFFGVARRRRSNAQRATLRGVRQRQTRTGSSPMRLLVSPLATPLDAQAQDHSDDSGDAVDSDRAHSTVAQYGSINQ